MHVHGACLGNHVSCAFIQHESARAYLSASAWGLDPMCIIAEVFAPLSCASPCKGLDKFGKATTILVSCGETVNGSYARCNHDAKMETPVNTCCGSGLALIAVRVFFRFLRDAGK